MVSKPMTENILEVRNLSVDYASDTGTVHAVDDVSFTVKRGEIFGLAGESGSGKSTLAFALARLLKFPAQITNGEIQFNLQPDPPAATTLGDSVDILELLPEDLRQFRWNAALDRLSKRNERPQSGTEYRNADHRRHQGSRRLA